MANKQIYLVGLFLLIFLPVVSAGACCMNPYPTSPAVNDGIFISSTVTQADCVALGMTYIADCTEATGLVKQSVATQQCCFDTQNTTVDFGAASAGLPPDSIYQGYCLANAGYTSKPTNTPGLCVASPTQYYNQVVGTVRMNNASGIVLQGITVQSQSTLINDITDVGGNYDLGVIPGVDNGQNVFTAVAPANYQVLINNQWTDVLCQSITVTRQFSAQQNTIQEINITLQCQEIGQACVPDWEVGDWGSCRIFGGQYVKSRSVVDTNNCGITTNKPISVLTSSTPAPEGDAFDCPVGNFGGTCGNGKVDPDEWCDGNEFRQLDGTITTIAPSCSALGYSGVGQVTCASDCGYDYSQCFDPCAFCDGTKETCDNCPNCQNAPQCEIRCDEVVPVFMDTFEATERSQKRNVFDSYDQMIVETGIFYDLGSNDVEVKWQFSPSQACANDLQGFVVHVCEESIAGDNTCKPLTKKTFYAGANTRSTTLPNVLEPNTNYCYNLCTLTVNGKEFCAFNATNEPLPCFNSGDAYCQEEATKALTCKPDTLGKLQPTGCTIQSFSGRDFTNLTFAPAQTQCNPDEVCVNTPYVPNDPNKRGAMCAQAGECELCNGLFGLYSNYELTSEIDGVTVSCVDFEYSPANYQVTPSNNIAVGLCYEDRIKGAYFDAYQSCEEVETCYDYQTADTCVQDPCYRFSEGTNNGCEWNSYAGELGVGVCAPKETTQQDCQLCDYESPTGICDATMCGLYGDCYFKEGQNHYFQGLKPENAVFSVGPNSLNVYKHQQSPLFPSCLPQEALTCFFYQNESDCEGGQASSVDVTYDANGNRVAGTNTRTPSKDLYGLGTCKWLDLADGKGNQGCYKDSDDYYTPGASYNYSDDCYDANGAIQGFLINSQEHVDCLFDHEPPTTTLALREATTVPGGKQLPIYGLGELDELQFVVSDNTWGAEKLQTRIVLVKATCQGNACTVYPQHTVANYTDPADSLNTASFTNGEYLLRYYSFDPANNLEVVQEERIYLDTVGPQLTAGPVVVIDTFKLGEDIFRSNITITFAINENAYCIGKLHYAGLKTGIVSGQNIDTAGTSFEAKYIFQQDGSYTFNYTCLDDYGNDLVGSVPVIVEADPSITNPQPKEEIYASLADVPLLQITSISQAQCKFSLEDKPYAQSQGVFQTTNGLLHTYDVTSASASSLGFSSTSNHYFVQTSCLFTNGDLTEQNPADVIIFTIDNLPPTIEVSTRSASNDPWQAFSLSQTLWAPQRQLQLQCDDFHNLIPLDQFGCRSIEYCFAQPQSLSSFSSTNCVSPLQTVLNDNAVISVSSLTHDNLQLYYRATDNGNNVGNWQRINPKVRDVEFTDPVIYFLNN